MSDLSQVTCPTRVGPCAVVESVGGSEHIPNVPDPQRDAHEAFREHDNLSLNDSGTGRTTSESHLPHALPGSAWAGPPTRQPRPLLATPPNRPSRKRSQQRLAAALAAVAILGAGVIGAVNSSASDGSTTVGRSGEQQYADSVDNDGFVDEDQSVVAIPPTFTRLRLEVAGSGDAELEVKAKGGVSYEQPVTLPLRHDVSGQAVGGKSFGVVVTGNGPIGPVQCRLYADDRLVKIMTGDGAADCTVLVP